MRREKRPREGPDPDPGLVDLFHQFEKLCEIEGPGAADEGDLSRLRREMTDCFLSGDSLAFLATLSQAMRLRDGIGLDYPDASSD
jgi:hypothetical protein